MNRPKTAFKPTEPRRLRDRSTGIRSCASDDSLFSDTRPVHFWELRAGTFSFGAINSPDSIDPAVDAPYPPATGAVGFASGRGVDAEMRASSAARSGVGARLLGNPDRDGGRDAGISDEDMRADSMPSGESSGVRSAPSTRKQSLMLMQEGGLNSVRVRARRTHRDCRARSFPPSPILA